MISFRFTCSGHIRYRGLKLTRPLGKRAFRAEELSALILRSLKEDAEAVLQREVTEAVMDADARITDLKVLQSSTIPLFDEAVATALRAMQPFPAETERSFSVRFFRQPRATAPAPP